MKNAIIVKYKEANCVIITPKISSEQIFKAISLVMDNTLNKSQPISDDSIRLIFREIGLEDIEIVEIAAEIN